MVTSIDCDSGHKTTFKEHDNCGMWSATCSIRVSPVLSGVWWKSTFIQNKQPVLVITVFTLWWRQNWRMICHYIVMESRKPKRLSREKPRRRGQMHLDVERYSVSLKITGYFNLLLTKWMFFLAFKKQCACVCLYVEVHKLWQKSLVLAMHKTNFETSSRRGKLQLLL